jgi:DNA replication protein DnaC
MNNPTVAEVIAAFRRDRINVAYLSQQKADSLPGMRDLRIRKKKLFQKILAGSLHDTENGSFLRELEDIGQQEREIVSVLPGGFACSLCGDTGFVDGHFCSCLRDKIYTEAYGAMDIGALAESFETSDRSKFSDTFICKKGATQREKYIALENYAKKYAEDFPDTQTPNLLLTGNTGLGKTFILRSIAKHVYQNSGDVMLISASNLFSDFLQHRLGFDVNLDILNDCGLLLIDDLGVEPLTQNVTIEYFLELLNNRTDKKRHTVIATNLSTDNIIAKYGERVYSRIRFNGLCDQMVFEGTDIRLK